MADHGLRDWRSSAGAKQRAGISRYASKQIGLSRLLTALHSKAELRDTILHETATTPCPAGRPP